MRSPRFKQFVTALGGDPNAVSKLDRNDRSQVVRNLIDARGKGRQCSNHEKCLSRARPALTGLIAQGLAVGCPVYVGKVEGAGYFADVLQIDKGDVTLKVRVMKLGRCHGLIGQIKKLGYKVITEGGVSLPSSELYKRAAGCVAAAEQERQLKVDLKQQDKLRKEIELKKKTEDFHAQLLARGISVNATVTTSRGVARVKVINNEKLTIVVAYPGVSGRTALKIADLR